MLMIIGSEDKYLSDKLRKMTQEAGFITIGTNRLERITKELKAPDRMVIIDMGWEVMLERGVLKRLVNIARITGNRVICLCPNTEEDAKKIARQSRADEVFIRYDIETRFRDFLKEAVE